MNNIQVKYTIFGRVQGVGYRYYVYKNATELGLKGYAKNNFDGTVEVVVDGNSDSIEIIERILKVGPARSNVDRLRKEELLYENKFTGFDIY
jgi:acylphosphatase